MNSKKKTKNKSKRVERGLGITGRLSNIPVKYLAVLVLILILISVGIAAISAFMLSVAYPSGWEIGSSCNRVSLNEIIMYPDTSNSEFINGSYLNSRGGYLKLDDGELQEQRLPANVYSQHPAYFGSTAVFADVDAPYPVVRDSYTGEWELTTDGDPFRTYQKQDSNDTSKWYFYNHFVYFFTVDIKSSGVAELFSSYVWGTCEGLPSSGGARDHTSRVRVFSDFGLSPWQVTNGQIYTVNRTSQIQVSDVFYGIMSSSVAEVSAGAINPIGVDYDYVWYGLADPHKDHSGASLAMWRNDDASSFAGYGDTNGEVSEAVVKSVPNTIPKNVVIEVAANIEPGLLVHAGTLPGTWADWTPLDNYVRTVIRMDAVYSAGLVTLSGGQDPAGNKTSYQPPDDVKTVWEMLGDSIDAFFSKIGGGISEFLNGIIGPIIVVAVIMVIIVIFCVCIRRK